MAITYNNLYLDLRRRFRAAGAFDPTRAARELICSAAGWAAPQTQAPFV